MIALIVQCLLPNAARRSVMVAAQSGELRTLLTVSTSKTLQ